MKQTYQWTPARRARASRNAKRWKPWLSAAKYRTPGTGGVTGALKRLATLLRALEKQAQAP